MHATDDLITTAEVADLASKDRSTVTRWVQAGRLTPAKRTPGGLMLFRRSDIDAFLAEATS